jgi:hypothetical protein
VTGASWVGTASAATVSSYPVRQGAAHARLHQVSLSTCHLALVSETNNSWPVLCVSFLSIYFSAANLLSFFNFRY